MAEKTNNALLWAIGGVLILLGVVYFSITGAPSTTIKIGVLTPLTGDAAGYGIAIQRAYDLAVAQVNAAGGVGGKPLELVYEDSKCDGAAATASTQKLVNVDGVRFILGGTCSGETLAAAPITREARVLLLSPWATSPDITQAGDLVFRTYPSDDFEARLVAAHAADNGHLRAALISQITDFTRDAPDAFKTSFTGKIVFDETFNTDETDFDTVMATLRRANPQMIYVRSQSPAAGELMLKQINESGMNVAVYANSAMLGRSAIAANPSIYEEVVMAQVRIPSEGKAVAMLEAYEERYGNAPEFVSFTASAYDSVFLLAEALGSVGEDAQAVAEYFNTSINDWPGAIGAFSFDENGDAQVELSLVRVIGGELVELAE